MVQLAKTMNTDEVSVCERIPYWTDWVDRQFHGLSSDHYGDTRFDGRMDSLHAGDVILTRPEACRVAFDDPRLARRSIIEIALACGFTSPAHFSRVFRACSGLSPSEYRRSRLGGQAAAGARPEPAVQSQLEPECRP